MATKMMKDPEGNEVPLKYVSKYDRLRDKNARKVYARWMKMRENLEKLVTESLKDLEEVRAEGQGKGTKGNFSFVSFDGKIQIEVRQDYRICLDERVSKARELMLEYARGLVEKTGDEVHDLLEIVNNSFEASRSGILPIGKILSLLRYNITAPKWLEAKQLLEDSIQPVKGKQYLHCSTRPDRQHDYQTIRLDIADCWPKEDE